MMSKGIKTTNERKNLLPADLSRISNFSCDSLACDFDYGAMNVRFIYLSRFTTLDLVGHSEQDSGFGGREMRCSF